MTLQSRPCPFHNLLLKIQHKNNSILKLCLTFGGINQFPTCMHNHVGWSLPRIGDYLPYISNCQIKVPNKWYCTCMCTCTVYMYMYAQTQAWASIYFLPGSWDPASTWDQPLNRTGVYLCSSMLTPGRLVHAVPHSTYNIGNTAASSITFTLQECLSFMGHCVDKLTEAATEGLHSWSRVRLLRP